MEATNSNQPYRQIIKPPGRVSFNFNELWSYKELFYFLTWRDIKVKYKQTLIGFAWAVLQPLLMMVVFTLIFNKSLNIQTEGIAYPIFAYSGLLLWNIFSSGLTASANSMVDNAQIIKKIYFPRLIIPASSLLVALFDFLMAFIVYIGLLIYFQQGVTLQNSWAAILGLLLTVITTLGLGTIVAALNVKYRDFRYIVPFIIQFLFFLNPVVYPTSIIRHPVLQYIIASNPISGAIELFRFGLLGQPINWTHIAISFASAIILLFIGLFTFRKMENYFADLA